jgi:hypothetical protein
LIKLEKGRLYAMTRTFTGYIVDTTVPIHVPPYFNVVSQQSWNVNCSGTA